MHTGESIAHRAPNAGAFSVRTGLPQNIVLLEDVYVTGARAQSAAKVLRSSGVSVRFILSVGRRYNLDFDGEVRAIWDRQTQMAYAPSLVPLK